MSSSGRGYVAAPPASYGTVFVTTAGSDTNNGLSPGSAKATVNAAYAALPASGGIIQCGAGTFPLSTAGTNGLAIASKPVGIRGVGKTRTTLTYAGTGAAIRVGVGESVTPFLDWGFLEDLTVSTANVAGVRGIVIDGAHRGTLRHVEVFGTSNAAGSIGIEGFDAYQNYVTDGLVRGYAQAVVLRANSNDFSFTDTSMDSTGLVCNVIDSTGVRIRGGQISGLGSPCGVQVDAVAANVTGFELANVYFDSGAGGAAISIKLGPAATSVMLVLSPTIISAVNMGMIVDRCVAPTIDASNIVAGHALTLTANTSDGWVRYYLGGGTFSDGGTRNTVITPNGSKQFIKNVVANDASFGFKHSSAGGQSLWFETAGDANPSFTCTAAGIMAWGAGGSAGTDITLSRYAANAARVLVTNRPFRAFTGITANRPVAADAGAGAQMYDTTLSKPIWSDGTIWRDAAGTAV